MAESENTNPTPAALDSSAEATPEIDLQALAERVYRLMKEEARLQAERQTAGGLKQRKVTHGY
jgi:hypothetical protein